MAVEVIEEVFKSIKSYFKALSQFGYKKQSDVDRLLVYNFIIELLTGDMRIYITEDDYRSINQALNCLYGSSCLIPYPQYRNEDALFGHLFDQGIISPRITQDNNLRFTEDDTARFRAANYNR